MRQHSSNPAQRRYHLRIGAAMGLYIIMIAFEHRLFDAAAPSTRYLLAALPALPVMACFAIMGRYLVEEKDEYIRMQVAVQSLWATGIMLSVATLWGFLEDAGVPHVPMFYVAVGWFAALGLVACVQRVRGA
ncbi:hypothetical protein [Sphingomonas crusticola]|uniref:hypothetical protein n=1 Tax=Sphingomonas crusticola TaxID=1697973 RepID=UPI000E238CC0|nr:hypothetical protein [Sphingomonas crusticola]